MCVVVEADFVDVVVVADRSIDCCDRVIDCKHIPVRSVQWRGGGVSWRLCKAHGPAAGLRRKVVITGIEQVSPVALCGSIVA